MMWEEQEGTSKPEVEGSVSLVGCSAARGKDKRLQRPPDPCPASNSTRSCPHPDYSGPNKCPHGPVSRQLLGPHLSAPVPGSQLTGTQLSGPPVSSLPFPSSEVLRGQAALPSVVPTV